jgi:hypothetical protein
MRDNPVVFARIGLLLMLVVHLSVTVPSLVSEGLLSPFPPFEKLSTTQIFSDLICALTLFFVPTVLEFRRQQRGLGWSVALFIGIVLSGSIAPMMLLLLDRPLLDGLLARR